MVSPPTPDTPLTLRSEYVTLFADPLIPLCKLFSLADCSMTSMFTRSVSSI
jgi:hypothetical protein